MNANTEQQKINIFARTDGKDSEVTVVNVYKCDDGDVNEEGSTGFVGTLSAYADRNAIAVFEMPVAFSTEDFSVVSEAVDSAFGWTIKDLLKDVAKEVGAIQDEANASCGGHLEGGEILDKNVSSVMMDSAISNFEL